MTQKKERHHQIHKMGERLRNDAKKKERTSKMTPENCWLSLNLTCWPMRSAITATDRKDPTTPTPFLGRERQGGTLIATSGRGGSFFLAASGFKTP